MHPLVKFHADAFSIMFELSYLARNLFTKFQLLSTDLLQNYDIFYVKFEKQKTRLLVPKLSPHLEKHLQ